MWIFLSAVIFKSRLFKMAATSMTVEFGTIHHHSSMEENSEACLCGSLDRYKNLLNIMYIVAFRFRVTMFYTATWIQISLIPTLCMLNRNWRFLHFQKEFLIFSFCICKLAITFYMINELQAKENFRILSNAPLIKDILEDSIRKSPHVYKNRYYYIILKYVSCLHHWTCFTVISKILQNCYISNHYLSDQRIDKLTSISVCLYKFCNSLTESIGEIIITMKSRKW